MTQELKDTILGKVIGVSVLLVALTYFMFIGYMLLEAVSKDKRSPRNARSNESVTIYK